jgi:hypothetical protein
MEKHWPEFMASSARLPMPDKGILFQLKICCSIYFLLLKQMPNSNTSAQWLPIQPAILPMLMLGEIVYLEIIIEIYQY